MGCLRMSWAYVRLLQSYEAVYGLTVQGVLETLVIFQIFQIFLLMLGALYLVFRSVPLMGSLSII